MRTSVSDYDDYKRICFLAATDENYFNNFKTHPAYTPILEHCTYEHGKFFLDWCFNSKSFTFEKLNKSKKNDTLGGALVADYGSKAGTISPNTLRYFKVMLELEDLFGDLSNKDIVEIGVGYGGQCKLIKDNYNTKSYTLIDLKEPLLLSEKYLQDKSVNFYTMKDIPDNKTYDLVISNYAFTECSKEVQMIYIDKIIKNSKHGYITFNNISHLFDVSSFSKQELLQYFPFKEIPEYPLSRYDNSILIW